MIDRALATRKCFTRIRRATGLLASRRSQLLAVCLWSAVAGVILLPALSQIGYPVWSLEYVLVLLEAILAGLGCYLASRLRAAGVVLLTTLNAFSFLLYFGAVLLNSLYLVF